jgi:hypothetical protein
MVSAVLAIFLLWKAAPIILIRAILVLGAIGATVLNFVFFHNICSYGFCFSRRQYTGDVVE